MSGKRQRHRKVQWRRHRRRRPLFRGENDLEGGDNVFRRLVVDRARREPIAKAAPAGFARPPPAVPSRPVHRPGRGGRRRGDPKADASFMQARPGGKISPGSVFRPGAMSECPARAPAGWSAFVRCRGKGDDGVDLGFWKGRRAAVMAGVDDFDADRARIHVGFATPNTERRQCQSRRASGTSARCDRPPRQDNGRRPARQANTTDRAQLRRGHAGVMQDQRVGWPDRPLAVDRARGGRAPQEGYRGSWRRQEKTARKGAVPSDEANAVSAINYPATQWRLP